MRGRSVLFALILTSLVLASAGCRQEFKQATLAPGEIPVDVREYTEKRPTVNNPVWRAYYDQGELEIAVASFLGDDTLYGSFPGWIWVLSKDGQVLNSHAIAGLGDYPNRRPEPYYWSPREKLSIEQPGGQSRYMIAAPGYAWHTAAFRVIGTTTQGRTYEGRVVNGYWILYDPDIEGVDRFETAVVQDQQGKVLYTYTRTD